MHVKIYTKDSCSFCYAAKHLLTKRGIAWEEIPVNGNASAEQEMHALTGRSTVPQILIDGTSIGGYSELVDMDMEGKLQRTDPQEQA